MHFHFGRLKLVELFSDCCLILRCESCPRFVCPSIVVACAGHLNVIVESDNLVTKVQINFTQYLKARLDIPSSPWVPQLWVETTVSVKALSFSPLFAVSLQQEIALKNSFIYYGFTRHGKTSLFRIFLSSSSSWVGLMLSLLISLAPTASLVSRLSRSLVGWRMFRSISSCRGGRIAIFSARLSFRVTRAPTEQVKFPVKTIVSLIKKKN